MEVAVFTKLLQWVNNVMRGSDANHTHGHLQAHAHTPNNKLESIGLLDWAAGIVLDGKIATVIIYVNINCHHTPQNGLAAAKKISP